MMKIYRTITVVLLFFTISVANADEINLNNKNTEFSFYSGMFDFSDDGKRSTLIGIQHQNEELNRNEGRLSSNGTVIINTGIYTGRSPNDRFIVKETKTKEK